MMVEVFSLIFIALLGAISPGPDFVIVTRHALTGYRKAALQASLGISLALIIHATLCSLGIALILAQSIYLFRAIQVAGSCYLAYLGIQLLKSSKNPSVLGGPPLGQAFFSGFFTNLLNPKATFFILSIFTQFVQPGTPFVIQFLYGLIISATTLAWFCSLSFLITHPSVHSRFANFQAMLMKGMGVVLIFLACATLTPLFFNG